MRGFTLTELMVAMAVTVILASIAIPLYRDIVVRADATAVIAEADMIASAAYKYEVEEGGFPYPAAWGFMPPELEPHLPPGFDFTYDGRAEFQWHATHLAAEGTGARAFDIVMIGVRTEDQSLLRAIEQVYAGQTIGAGSVMYLVLRWG